MIEYLDKEILEREDIRMDYGLGSIFILFMGIIVSLLNPIIGFYTLISFYLVFGGKILLGWLWH